MNKYHFSCTLTPHCNWLHFHNKTHLCSSCSPGWCWCFESYHSLIFGSRRSWPDCEKGPGCSSFLHGGCRQFSFRSSLSGSECCRNSTAVTFASRPSSFESAWTIGSCMPAFFQAASTLGQACWDLSPRRCRRRYARSCHQPLDRLWLAGWTLCQTHLPFWQLGEVVQWWGFAPTCFQSTSW